MMGVSVSRMSSSLLRRSVLLTAIGKDVDTVHLSITHLPALQDISQIAPLRTPIRNSIGSVTT